MAGEWAYLYRAIDQHGQVIDVFLSARRDLAAARRFFARALRAGTVPAEVTTDRAPVYPRVLDELVPSALHTVEQYANNPIEADHGRLKARLRPETLPLGADRSPPVTPSCRICAAVTMTSLPKSPATTGSARHSTTSRSPSEPTAASGSCSNTVQRRHNATVRTEPVLICRPQPTRTQSPAVPPQTPIRAKPGQGPCDTR